MFQLTDVINTLNQIEVRGRENLDKLLGCILALEQFVQAQQSAEAEGQTEEVTEEDG